MKKLMLNFTLILFTASAFAAIRETGGSSPAPRAVVIQGYAVAGKFDIQGHRLALNLIARYVAANQLTAFTHRSEDQSSDRTYMCIEFASAESAWKAEQIFKQQLAARTTMEVVNSGRCR